MIKKVQPTKGGKGGTIYPIQKGEIRNKTGRPSQPRKLKDFIKALETEDDVLMFEVEQVEIVEKNGKKYVKIKNAKGGKMFVNALQRAINGDARWADFLVKMGFAGGYEPVKTKTEVTGVTLDSVLDSIKNINDVN